MWATPEQVREAIQGYVKLDVDFLKYGASGHAQMQFIQFSPRVQHIIIEEGHRAGMTVQAHTTSTESLDMAIEAGLDIITHCGVSGAGTPLADDVIQKMADRKVPCSVLPVTQRRLDAMLEEYSEQMVVGFMKTMKENHKKMIEAGVTMLVSTDAGIRNPVLASERTGAAGIETDSRVTLGEGHFNALVALQEMGMAPMEILKSVTSHSARAYKMDSEFGSLEVGKAGDLVILDEDPLADAANYRTINTVIKDGNHIDIDALPLAPLISSMTVKQTSEKE